MKNYSYLCNDGQKNICNILNRFLVNNLLIQGSFQVDFKIADVNNGLCILSEDKGDLQKRIIVLDGEARSRNEGSRSRSEGKKPVQL